MQADELALFTGVTDADRLASLREQLWLLTAVLEQVQAQGQSLRALVTGNPGYHWRSAAERGYAAQAQQLGTTLDRAGRELEAALEVVRNALVRLIEAG